VAKWSFQTPQPKGKRWSFQTGAAPALVPRRSALQKIGAGAESIGKGLLRSVGYERPYDPEEYKSLGSAAEILGTLGQTALLFTGVGGLPVLGARGLTGLAQAGRIARVAKPALTFAARSGIATGGQEAIRQAVGAATQGRPFQPESIGYQALYGAAIPLAAGAAGAGLKAGLAATPLRDIRIGAALGKTVGRIIPYDLKRAITPYYQTPSRRLAIAGLDPKWKVEQAMNLAERWGGYAHPAAAREIGRTWEVVAKTLRQPEARNELKKAARLLQTQLTFAPGAPITWGPRTTQRVGDKALGRIADHLSKALKAKDLPAEEAAYLQHMWEAMLLERAPGGVGKVADFTRGFLSYYYLGMGSLSTFFVNLTGLLNVTTRFGTANVMRAAQHFADRTPLARVAAKNTLGKGFGQFAAQGGIFPMKKIWQNVAGGSILWGERIMRPIAGMARYFQIVDDAAALAQKQGLAGRALKIAQAKAHGLGVRAMQQAARETLFDYRYNAPRIMTMPSKVVGPISRLALMFFNFPLQQASFAGGLKIPEFAQWAAQLWGVGGVAALPFATQVSNIAGSLPNRVAERLPHLMAGVSVLQAVTARPEYRDDPRLRALIEGPLAAVANVQLGRRMDFSESLTQRLLNWAENPFSSWAQGFGEAYNRFGADPSRENLVKLAMIAAAPLQVQRIGEAIRTEEAGAFTTRRGQTLPGEVTEGALGRQALGFVPHELAAGRAQAGVIRELEKRRGLETETPREQLRLAVIRRDQDAIARAVRRMVQLGYDQEAIRRLIKEARLPPERRLLRETPKVLRPKVRPILFPQPKATPTPKWSFQRGP